MSEEEKSERQGEVTRLLKAGGDERGDLFNLVYEELRGIAAGRFSRERGGHTLQATAVVHEAYMRLIGTREATWEERGEFYAAAAEAMRRVLIDHARKVGSQKRGGNHDRVTLGAAEGELELDAGRALDLNDALERLAGEDERAASVARLRFLSGLTVEETAGVLNISERSVHREWTYARARLVELMGED